MVAVERPQSNAIEFPIVLLCESLAALVVAPDPFLEPVFVLLLLFSCALRCGGIDNLAFRLPIPDSIINGGSSQVERVLNQFQCGGPVGAPIRCIGDSGLRRITRLNGP